MLEAGCAGDQPCPGRWGLVYEGMDQSSNYQLQKMSLHNNNYVNTMNMFVKTSITAVVLPLLLILAVPVNATEDDGLLELMSVLRDNGTITDEQYQRIARAIEKGSDDEATEEAEPQVKTGGGFEIARYDGKFSFELGGRLMIDAAGYDEDLNRLGDGTELRRARLDAEGRMFGDWGYEFEIDFADGDADIKDAYISYDGFAASRIKVGQFKEPFSLEELTSSRYITFMERALPNELAPGRHIGIGADTRWDQWTLAGGVFGESFDDDVDDEGNEGWGLTGRVTYAPWQEDRRALHFGLAASRRWTDSMDEAKFDSRPESHITDVKYLNTGTISNVETIDRYGLEAATVLGPWSLQGEYIHTTLNRDSGMSDVDMDGWYLQASWFLTGESRNYKFKKGAFGRVKPRNGYGAWELAGRVSELDLNDEDIQGGEERNWTLGLNWYINPNVRVMANYISVDNDVFADDDGDVIGNDDPNIFQTRLQLDF